jgi:hypothetical protein
MVATSLLGRSAPGAACYGERFLLFEFSWFTIWCHFPPMCTPRFLACFNEFPSFLENIHCQSVCSYELCKEFLLVYELELNF